MANEHDVGRAGIGSLCLGAVVSLALGCGAAVDAATLEPQAEAPPVEVRQARTAVTAPVTPVPEAVGTMEPVRRRPLERGTPSAGPAAMDRCAGEVESLHFYDYVTSPEAIPAWRQAVRDFDRCVLGLDGHVAAPLDLAIDAMVRVSDRVTRYHLTYSAGESYAGRELRIPAYLFVPDGSRQVPAVIVYHGHGEGKINVAERPGTTENAIGRELAQTLGYVVLAPDARTFGEYVFAPHEAYHRELREDVGSYMGRVERDGYQDMALLASLPSVDPSRIGVAGVSMGSWRALHHALLHEEVRATVVAGLFIPFEFLFSRGHDACQHLPALSERLKMEDLAAAIAPRSLMVQWGAADWFYGDDAPGLLARARSLFVSMGVPELFVPDVNPGIGHQFQNANVAAYLRAALGPGAWDGA